MYTKVHITAEIGTSHEGDIKKAKELIKAAANAGADSIKLQWVYANEILHPKTGFVLLPTGNIPLYDRFKQLEVSPDFFKELKEYAKSCNCSFICSPFGKKSLEELIKINPDAIKIASPELNHFPLLEQLSNFRLQQKNENKNITPIILSTGVSTLSDIEKALNIFEHNKEKITLLHCITAYPAPEEQYNLLLIKNLSSIFGIPTGISDHSLDPILVPTLAVACGATFIEKHITLSRKTIGLDDPVALEPKQFEQMVSKVRYAEKILQENEKSYGQKLIIKELEAEYGKEFIQKILGNGIKTFAFAEKDNYGRTNRSIHVINSLKAGSVLTKNDLSILRTEKILTPGISPIFINDVTGAILTKDISAGEGLTWQHIIKYSTDT